VALLFYIAFIARLEETV